ncbi:MAG: transglycosylase domain-containing protein [Bacteroidales bacterium]|nr:transglycosylase domain-containing protein [Bacteroidales bacterium]MBN2698542.1 transglycosylase domain-containing protein [Bacteroidales bacterium]
MLKKTSKSFIYLTILWSLYAFIIVLFISIFVMIGKGRMGFMPGFSELENPQTNLASEIYTDSLEVLGKYFIENRTFVDFEDLSPNLVNALIATEDIRFYRHSGIDVRSLVRVLVKSVLLGQDAGGGSTLSQQLAKNLFPRDTTYRRTAVGKAAHLAMVKFKEWNTAVRLERSYTKNEIILMYLNTVAFGGESIVGINSAAKTFFNTTTDSLSIEQAAVLVGMLKAPTAFNPRINPERSMERRNTVINQMARYEFIDARVADSVKQLPTILDYNIASHMTGHAQHFRTFLSEFMNARKPEPPGRNASILASEKYRRDSLRWARDPLYGWINKNYKPDGSQYNLYKDGLKIYTTINLTMQKYAEQAIEEHLKNYLQPYFFKEKKGRRNAPFEEVSVQEIEQIMRRSMRWTDRYKSLVSKGVSSDSIDYIFKQSVPMQVFSWHGPIDTVLSPYDSIRYMKHILRAGFMAMEPWSGRVKVYVGGHNYQYFQYDHVYLGRRQVGSTVKPFLYLLAMQENYSPCYMIPLVPVTFEDIVNDSIYQPRATSLKFAGNMVSLKWGLANSHNWVSAWLFKNFNPLSMINEMRKMGITSFIDPVPSMIYGPSDISLEEMVGAFNTFTNRGIYVSPVYVTRIEDRYGNVIGTFLPDENEAINEHTAFLMLMLLRNVVDMIGQFKGEYYSGTAHRLRSLYQFEGEMAGKTGTTQNQSDGWFVGLVPKLTAAIWVGGEDRSIHFDELGMGAGSNMALPIYGEFMKRIYADPALHITMEDEFVKPDDFFVDLDCPNILEPGGSERYNEF